MFRLLLTTVIIGINVAACYFVWMKEVEIVIMLSVFGIFTNEVMKLLYPTILVMKGVIPHGRQ